MRTRAGLGFSSIRRARGKKRKHAETDEEAPSFNPQKKLRKTTTQAYGHKRTHSTGAKGADFSPPRKKHKNERLKSRSKKNLLAMSSNFKLRLEESLKRRKKERLKLSKLYKSQLNNRHPNLEGTKKRKFIPEIHYVDNDQAIAAKTLGNIDNLPKLPGRILKEKITCNHCKAQFVTSEAYLNHRRYDNLDKKSISLSAFNKKSHEYVLICPLKTCCYNTRDLTDYFDHMRDHGIHTRDTVFIHQDKASQQKNLLECNRCSVIFSRKDSLKRHQLNCLGNQPICCSLCHATFDDTVALIDHIEAQHKPQNDFKLVHEFVEPTQENEDDFIGYTEESRKFQEKTKELNKRRSVFKNYVLLFDKVKDITEILNSQVLEQTIEHLNYEVSKNYRIKFSFYCHTIISKIDAEGKKKYDNSGLISSTDFGIYYDTDVRKIAESSFKDLLARAEQVS